MFREALDRATSYWHPGAVAVRRGAVTQVIHGLRERVMPHLLQLAIVMTSAAVGQVATLIHRPLACYCADTHSYLVAAAQIANSPVHLIQPLRTPGYPALLAIFIKLTGTVDPNAVVAVQAVIALVTLIETYVLVVRVTQHRWIACIVASLIGTNLYILDWERAILSELLSFWALVTIFLCYERLVRNPATGTAIVFAAFSFAAIMIRPFNLYLPFLLLALLLARSAWLHEGRRYWKPVLASAMLVGLGLGGYMLADKQVNGTFGLSWVTNLNLFGKVLEYHMEGLPVPPQYLALQADVEDFVTHNPPYPIDPWPSVPPDPWVFVQAHENADARYGPGMSWVGGYRPIGNFAETLIVRNLPQYVASSLPDVYAAWQPAPAFYAPYAMAPGGSWTPDSKAIPGFTGYTVFGRGTASSRFEPPWVTALLIASSLAEGSYALLPVLVLILACWVWRRPRDTEAYYLLAMLSGLVGSILFGALGAYSEFYRMRSPMDWAMITVALVVMIELVIALTRKDAHGVARPPLAPAAPMPERVESSPVTMLPSRPRADGDPTDPDGRRAGTAAPIPPPGE
jgi:hypothetical protein